jgi:hypothetical protein
VTASTQAGQSAWEQYRAGERNAEAIARAYQANQSFQDWRAAERTANAGEKSPTPASTPTSETQKPKSFWQRAGEWSRIVDWEKGKENECKVAQADMTEEERLTAYKRTQRYQVQQKKTLLYDLEKHYRVLLDTSQQWNFDEVLTIANGVSRMSQSLGGPDVFTQAIGEIKITLVENSGSGGLTFGSGKIEFLRTTLTSQSPQWLGEVAVVHELAHAWAFHQTPWLLRMMNVDLVSRKMRLFVGAEEGPTKYGQKNWLNPAEEWAESVAGYVYPEYINHLKTRTQNAEPSAGLGPRHKEFVEEEIQQLQRNNVRKRGR